MSAIAVDRPSEGSPFVRDLLANDVTAQGHNLTASWDGIDSLTLKSITDSIPSSPLSARVASKLQPPAFAVGSAQRTGR